MAVNAVGHKSGFNKFQSGASGNDKSQGYNKGQYKTQKFRPSYTGVKQPDQQCGRCGKIPAHRLDNCPAKGKTCLKCGKMGHFSNYCWSKNVNEVVQSSLEDLFLGMVSCNDDTEDWNIDLQMYGKLVNFKIDTGADTSIMSKIAFKNFRQKFPLQPIGGVRLNSPCGVIPCIGKLTANCVYNGTSFEFQLYVVDSNVSNLLSRKVAKKMGIVKRIHEIRRNTVFGDIGLIKTHSVKIKLKDNAQPYCLSTPRRIPIPLMDRVKNEIQRMVDMEVICKITEPTCRVVCSNGSGSEKEWKH